ncbi:MAG: hypothetical protein ACREM8_06015 [Vulcanimicrobiaceae bacterium]
MMIRSAWATIAASTGFRHCGYDARAGIVGSNDSRRRDLDVVPGEMTQESFGHLTPAGIVLAHE